MAFDASPPEKRPIERLIESIEADENFDMCDWCNCIAGHIYRLEIGHSAPFECNVTRIVNGSLPEKYGVEYKWFTGNIPGKYDYSLGWKACVLRDLRAVAGLRTPANQRILESV